MELGLSATRAPARIKFGPARIKFGGAGGAGDVAGLFILRASHVESSTVRHHQSSSPLRRGGPIQGKPIGTSSSFKPTRYHPNESSCGSMLEITCGGRSTVGNLWKKINQSFRGIVPEVCCEIMKIGMV